VCTQGSYTDIQQAWHNICVYAAVNSVFYCDSQGGAFLDVFSRFSRQFLGVVQSCYTTRTHNNQAGLNTVSGRAGLHAREIEEGKTERSWSRMRAGSLHTDADITTTALSRAHLPEHTHSLSWNFSYLQKSTKNWTVHGQLRHRTFPASSQHRALDSLATDTRGLYKFILHYITYVLVLPWKMNKVV